MQPAIDISAIPPKETTAAPDDFSHRWGSAAFKHKEFFEGSAGSLIFRNFVRSAFAIFPYAVVNVAVQNFFNKTINRPGAPGLGKLTDIFRGNANIAQATVTIALSFTTFRTISKIWNRNYDRIFGAKTEADSIKAVHDLGHNIVKDAKDITPLEFSVTGASAITLAAIRNGVKITHPAGGPVSYMRDLVANVLGYSVFFDITDRLFKTFGDSRIKRNTPAVAATAPEPATPVVDNSVLPLQRDRIHKADETPAPGPHSQKFARFTDDTLTRAVFRNATSVLVAAVPYIWTQRKGYDLAGWHDIRNSYGKDLKTCLAGFVLPFAIFTASMELYQRAYDKLFEKLDAKYSTRQHAMA